MTYHRPSELSEALRILAETGARPFAGGTDIFPATSKRAMAGETLDITAIPALRGISNDCGYWRIGATTCWADIAKADLPPAFDALKQAALQVGAVQIQNAATVAGNLCNASPAADGVPPLLVLDAEVELTSQGGTRLLPLSKFLQGVRNTALTTNELVTAILVPEAAAVGASKFVKLGARHSLVISIAMVAVRLELDEGLVSKAAVAVGACSPVAQRLSRFEAALAGKTPNDSTGWLDELEQDVRDVLSPIDDVRADAAYRRTAAVELVVRALKECAS